MANASDATGPDALLRRTRKAVLDVLVVDGVLIAVSGWLIRRRAGEPITPAPRALHDGLFLGLAGIAVASYIARRASIGTRGLPADRVLARFHRSHVAAAAIAALGIPIGLAYGWLVDPSLQGVAPFWVVPMAFGALAFPRRGEFAEALDAAGFPPPTDREAPGS